METKGKLFGLIGETGRTVVLEAGPAQTDREGKALDCRTIIARNFEANRRRRAVTGFEGYALTGFQLAA